MNWPVAPLLLWAAALALSVGLSVGFWRSTTGGQLNVKPNGRYRIFSRPSLTAFPLVWIVVVWPLAGDLEAGPSLSRCAMLVPALVVQAILVGLAVRHRRGRQAKRKDLFGE